MRKIYAFEMITADGYYEGPDQEFDWPNVDDEFTEFSTGQLDETDLILFGRTTYEGMAQYWTSQDAQDYDPVTAEAMNARSKIVVSTTLEKAEWANTRLVGSDVVGEIGRLKAQPGKDIAIFGSSALVVSLVQAGLVDELRIIVNPIVLGAGKSIFRTATERIGLELLSTRAFRSGNVLLTYRPLTAS
jgi:dihydrofolate reductase